MGHIKNKSIEISVAEVCYLIYFSLMLFSRGIGLHEGMLLYNITLVLGLILFGCKILLTEHSVYEYFWIGSILLISMIVYLKTGEKGLLVYMTMMLGIKGVSMNRVFRTGMIIWTVSFAGVLVATLTGILDEVYLMHIKNGIGYIICYAMGYPHPNVLHMAYMILIMFIMYNIGDASPKKIYFSSVLLFIGNIYIFIYSVSYTGFLVTTLFLLLNLYFRRRSQFSAVEKILIQMVFPFCALFSIIGPLAIKGHAFEIINNILNTRFNLARYFLTEQPISLFGEKFVVPNYRYTMDCSYVYAFMQLGIVPFVLICLLYILLIHDYVKKGKNGELAIILSICIAGLTEPFLFNLAYKNLIFLFAGEFLYRTWKHSEKRLPTFMKRKVCVLHIGYRKMKQNHLMTDCSWILCNEIANDKKNIYEKKIIITILVIASISVYYFCAVPRPQMIYVNGKIMNEGDPVTPEYMSEEDVRSVKAQGNYVKDYEGASKPMYAYYGNTALIEYYRNIISIDLGAGTLMGVFYVTFDACRRKRKN